MSKPVEMIPDTYTFCPRCAARVEIGRVPVGSILTCHLCHWDFTISHSSSPAGAGQGSRPAIRDSKTARPKHSAHPKAASLDSFRGCPPADLFFSGTFRLPLRRDVLTTFLSLTLLATVATAGVQLAIWCWVTDSETLSKSLRVLLWHGLLFSISFDAVLILLWTWEASAWGLNILRETSYGGDLIDSWPNPLALEGLHEWAFVACSLMLATLPGLLATPLWQWLNIPRGLAISVTVPILFPIFLLSTLETDSPTDPFSPAVWKSLIFGCLPWALFYVLTLMAASIAVALAVLCSRYGGIIVGTVATGSVATAGWLIYCRLLGRLAAFCSGRLPPSSEPIADMSAPDY